MDKTVLKSNFSLLNKHIKRHNILMIVASSIISLVALFFVIYWQVDENNISRVVDNLYLIGNISFLVISALLTFVLILQRFVKFKTNALAILIHTYFFLLLAWGTVVCVLDLRYGFSPLFYLMIFSIVAGLFVVEPLFFGVTVLASTVTIMALAFKDNASGSTTYTPSGNVTVSTVNAVASVSTASGTTTYKPAGTVSQPTFTGTSFNSTGSYTPAGTVSQPTFTGTSFNSTGSYTPAGNVSVSTANKTATVSTASGSTTYKPAGSVTAPTISVATAGATASIKNPTAVNVTKTVDTAAPGATAPANAITYASVSNENLSFYQIGYTTGNSITTSDVTVKTGDASYSASQPTFDGTATRLVTENIAVTTAASFSGTSGTLTVSGTPTGSVSQPTFEGTSATLTVSGTPTGSVSQPTFDGTGVRLKTGNIVTTTAASFTGTSGTIDITVS